MIAAALRTLQRVPGVVAALVARSFALMRVRERGINRGRWVDAIVQIGGGDDEQAGAWCSYFGWACWHIAALVLGCRVVSRTSGGVVRSWHYATEAERVQGTPQPGDLMCIVRDARHLDTVRAGGTVPGHLELVRRVHADGTLDTIGGNTTSADSAEGDGVYLHRGTYTLTDPRLIGFIRPRLERLH
jgi:hypothetical protein